MNYPNGVYIQLVPDFLTRMSLDDYVNKHLSMEPTLNYHCTIAYSKEPRSVKVEKEYINIIEANFNKFNVFRDCLVMEITNDVINKLHEYFKCRYGFKWGYDYYKPHITLAKSFTGDVKKLEFFTEPIRFNVLEPIALKSENKIKEK